jgi:cysteine desulfurase
MRVHLDHNATTPLRGEVREALCDAFDRLRGNPSAVHASGRAARALLDDARERTAAALGVHEDDLVFTSGGTEANDLAVAGALAAAGPGAGFVTTAVEHSSVLGSARRHAAAGAPVTLVGVDAVGRPRLEELVTAADGAALVSVMAANNELGTAVDVGAVVAALGERYGPARPRVHTDAVQALGKLPLDLAGWDVDLASLSGHKIGAPVGIGVLVRRRRTPLVPRLVGGGQEAGWRAGTESVALVHALARAVELAVAERETFAARARAHVENLWMGVRNSVPGALRLGPAADDPLRLPNTLNIHVPGTDGRTLVARLDLAGLEVSAGSACASGSLEPSHVLVALGLAPEVARAALRFSTGRATDDAEIAHAVEIVSRTLGKAS